MRDKTQEKEENEFEIDDDSIKDDSWLQDTEVTESPFSLLKDLLELLKQIEGVKISNGGELDMDDIFMPSEKKSTPDLTLTECEVCKKETICQLRKFVSINFEILQGDLLFKIGNDYDKYNLEYFIDIKNGQYVCDKCLKTAVECDFCNYLKKPKDLRSVIIEGFDDTLNELLICRYCYYNFNILDLFIKQKEKRIRTKS